MGKVFVKGMEYLCVGVEKLHSNYTEYLSNYLKYCNLDRNKLYCMLIYILYHRICSVY